MNADIREAALLALVQDYDAIRETIEVVREKRDGDDAVVAATFRGSTGRLLRGFVGLRRSDASGWRMAGGSWISGARAAAADAIWASSGGWGCGPVDPVDEEDASVRRAHGVSGGWVSDPAARGIRVTDPNGLVEEDVIEAGVGILMWEGDFEVSRATAELLGRDGRMIRSGPMRPTR